MAPENVLEGENPFEGLSGRDLTVLRLIVRQEVQAGVKAALDDATEGTEDLATIVCGSPDSPSAGLVGRVQTLETKALLAQWLTGMALGSSAAAVIGLLVAILTHQVSFP